jgi:DNA-binding Lrp family transcriptional regulator
MQHVLFLTVAVLFTGVISTQARARKPLERARPSDAGSGDPAAGKLSIKERTRITKYLYEVEGLSVSEVGERLGVSRQAIHDRLVRAGVKRRPPSSSFKMIDRETLCRLYVTERLPVYRVAEALNLAFTTVARELLRHGIGRRPRAFERRKRSAMDHLNIGESALIECPVVPKPHASLYSLASVRKIRISIRRVDRERVRVTRIE